MWRSVYLEDGGDGEHPGLMLANGYLNFYTGLVKLARFYFNSSLLSRTGYGLDIGQGKPNQL